MFDLFGDNSWGFIIAVIVLGLVVEGVSKPLKIGFVLKCVIFAVILAVCHFIFN